MDFQSLIRIAQQNSQAASGQSSVSRKESKSGFYSTKYEPPKKQSKEKKISANVQKFLQSQENNSKPNGTVRPQLDQDAYESREASQIYEKLLTKFESAPSQPSASKTTKSTRELNKTKTDKPKTSKDSSKSNDLQKAKSDKLKPGPIDEKSSKPTKSTNSAPPKPALDFNSLLKLAEQNKSGSKPVATTSKGGPVRLLTEKEKQKIAAEKERRNPQTMPKSIAIANKEDKPSASAKTIPNGKGNSAVPEKTRSFPPADVRTRQFPPSDVAKTRHFPPNGFDSGRARAPKPNRKRHIIDDDDSEYDSEMDDFIDDDEGADDYSQHIKDIFGYDKSRYRHIDEDADDNMVSTFAQQMREEQISKKIGLMEDLEDMRAEAAAEAEKKRRRKAKQ